MALAGREGEKHIIETQIGCVIIEVGARASRSTMNLFKVSEEQIHRKFCWESLEEGGITNVKR